jgi:hypothetical protein
MNAQYEDITGRIVEEPAWYDQNGTPRYGPFEPAHCPNIYAHIVVLLRIQCQSCQMKFDVEMHDDGFFHTMGNPKKLHYGDPPRHNCDRGGDTMNCEDLAVLEVWSREGGGIVDWQRRKDLEGLIE